MSDVVALINSKSYVFKIVKLDREYEQYEYTASNETHVFFIASFCVCVCRCVSFRDLSYIDILTPSNDNNAL